MRKLLFIQDANRSTLMTLSGPVAQELLDQAMVQVLRSSICESRPNIAKGTLLLECVGGYAFILADGQISVHAKAGWFFEYRVTN